MSDEREKSEARVFLRDMASDLQDRAAVDRYTSNIMSGSEGSKDYICEFIDVVHALRDEFDAWDKGHTTHDHKCKSRHFLAVASKMFDAPTTSPEAIAEECYIKKDIYQSLFLHADVDDADDRDVLEMICSLVEALFVLRDDFVAWGKDDISMSDWWAFGRATAS